MAIENDLAMPSTIPPLRNLGQKSLFTRSDHIHANTSNALTLEGIYKTQFLRSDEADTIEANIATTLTLFNNTHATGTVVEMQRNGTTRLKVSESTEVRLGDNAGVNKLTIKDSDGTVVAQIDSNGNLFIKGRVLNL